MENTEEPCDPLPLSKVVRIDQISDRFDHAIHEAIQNRAPWPSVEEYLGDTIEPVRSKLRKELLAVEASYRQQAAAGGNAANSDVRPGEAASPAEETLAHTSGEQPGAIVAGRYKLLEAIGEGGMGTVWVAEQTQPVRQRVALKLIKPGMDSKSVLARFDAERQALAVMDHPNIAKVLDGGLTDSGRPYFVMEYVKGLPITEYCEATRLSIPKRLELFVQVCQAVQHAHQKGIIHRDLKPSNILVAPYDDRPVPKVIDFGLAKAMHQPLTERTIYTAHETVLGTPLYMSPEQAQLNNLDIDTRSDLYSLGVLLYELLTGSTPLEKKRFKQAAWDEVRRIIREEEPLRPSAGLSSSDTLPLLAAGRQIEPARLTKLVRGELDWIVMKALEKDRTRRYETASGFALDIQRYLAGEPVLAAPPSARYRLWKFARKHQTALTTAAAMIVLLVAGVAVSVWQAVRATRALGLVVAAQRERALAQVDALRRAEIAEVPYLIEGLSAEIEPQMRQLLQQPKLGDKERLRLSLAMVAEDKAQVPFLVERLLTSEPAELLVIRGALLPFRDELVPEMWRVAGDPGTDKDRSFRALCALAALDPLSPRWNSAARLAAEALVAENPLLVATWVEALRPVRLKLLPGLRGVYRNEQRGDAERLLSARILADYAADQPELLANLLVDADDRQFPIIFSKLKECGEEGLPLSVVVLEAVLNLPTTDNPNDAENERTARRKARVAIALLRLGKPEKVWPLFENSADERVRSYLIHWSEPLGVEPQVVFQHWTEEKDVGARAALLLLLGEFPVAGWTDAQRRSLIEQLLAIFEKEPDPGLHSSSQWLLRRWKCDDLLQAAIERVATSDAQRRAGGGRRWYVNRQGQTFVIVDARQPYQMGSPLDEPDRDDNETPHQRTVGRRYAIAANPVSQEQFFYFLSEQPHDEALAMPMGTIGRTDLPQTGVSWYRAAEYCKWLSEKEGIPREQWCYEPNKQGKFAAGMRAKDKYLTLRGYRLPTEAEWEFACRAGTRTRFYFGQSQTLLGNYAWYKVNSGNSGPVESAKPDVLGLFDVGNGRNRTWPVAGLKPNDLGLFDMHGNVWQWCECPCHDYPATGLAADDDGGSSREVTNDIYGVLRGGAYDNLPGHVRAAYRAKHNPGRLERGFGFRPVQTVSF